MAGGDTGLKNDPQGREVFLLASTPLGKFLATDKRKRRNSDFLSD
jgi:hypothetical protein